MSTQTASQNRAYQDALKVLERYKTEGVPRDESDAFIEGVIQELEADNTGKFSDNVGQVGTWAVDVDAAFDRVKRGLADLAAKYGDALPQLRAFLSEWNEYDQRWVTQLSLSRDVASAHVSVLKRFDQVFIEMVMTIQNDADREGVILELDSFVNEDHDESTQMSQNFLTLKRDIDDFVIRFDSFVSSTDAVLIEEATRLQGEIEQLKLSIEALDSQIKEATMALLTSAANAETMVGLLGAAVTGTILATLTAQRVVEALDLSEKQDQLEAINKQQEGLAYSKSEFDKLRPDIYLICSKLVLFAEIWSSVRNQSVQFRETLKGGMGAATSSRFKLELKLARELCTPLIEGLDKYATQLENRPKRPSI